MFDNQPKDVLDDRDFTIPKRRGGRPMTVKAMSWVFDHSPYAGHELVVHLCLADIANDQHGHRIFLNQTALSKKARLSRKTANQIIQTMVADGFLEDTGERQGQTSSIKVFRLLYPEAVTDGYSLPEAVTETTPKLLRKQPEAVTNREIAPTIRTQVTQRTQCRDFQNGSEMLTAEGDVVDTRPLAERHQNALRGAPEAFVAPPPGGFDALRAKMVKPLDDEGSANGAADDDSTATATATG